MRFYSVYLGDGRYVNMEEPEAGSWEFGLNLDALTVRESYANEIYRRYKNHVNRYNSDGWPDVKLVEYDLVELD